MRLRLIGRVDDERISLRQTLAAFATCMSLCGAYAACLPSYVAANVELGEPPTDAAATDVLDAPLTEPGENDASVDSSSGASSDAGGRDAANDAAVDSGATTRLQCAFAVGSSGGGITISKAFYSGFRFQIATPVRLRRIGATLSNDTTGPASVFGAIVRLTGGSDTPDSATLTTPDVLARVVIPLPPVGASAAAVSAALTLDLEPGWYAAVFGAGAFGATPNASATAPSFGSGQTCTALPSSGAPFSIRQSDGFFGLQGVAPNFYVQY